MADAPGFIFGIHHFCDHRCWRCPLAERCRVHHCGRAREPASLRKRPAERVARVIVLAMQTTFEELAAMPEFHEVTCDGALDGARSSGDPGVERDVADRDRRSREAAESPMGVASREYADLSYQVVRGLRGVLASRRDRQALDACDRIEETCLSIASKIHRALTSASGKDHDPAEVQSDANGAAKVALLLIEESRQAWRVLMQPVTARAGGAPKRFIERLDALEAGVQRTFPRAMEFARPGFDTGDAPGAGAEIARAMLGAFRLGKPMAN